MTPLHVEEPAEQVLDLIYWRVIPTLQEWGLDSSFLSNIPVKLCCPPFVTPGDC